MKKEFVMPVVVLAVICLVVSAALAFTNDKTAPIIEENARKAAEAARTEMLPGADSFTELRISELPSSVSEAYKADNGAGYVIMLETKGYGGVISLICGIDGNGVITDCKALDHSETKGLGSKITDDDFRGQFAGKDSALSGVETISGASISSGAYINAIRDAFAAYEIIKEAE